MRKLFLTVLVMLPLTVYGEAAMEKNNAHEISNHYAAVPNFYELDSVKKKNCLTKSRVNMSWVRNPCW